MSNMSRSEINEYERNIDARMMNVDYDENPTAAEYWSSTLKENHNKEQDALNEYLDAMHRILGDRVAILDRISDLLD